MKNAFVLGSLFALVTCFAGCGSSAESMLKQQIAQLNELAEAIENDAPESEIEAIKERMEATAKKMKELEVSEAEQKRLQEKYEDDLKQAGERLGKAMFGKLAEGMGKGLSDFPGGGGLPNMPGN